MKIGTTGRASSEEDFDPCPDAARVIEPHHRRYTGQQAMHPPMSKGCQPRCPRANAQWP